MAKHVSTLMFATMIILILGLLLMWTQQNEFNCRQNLSRLSNRKKLEDCDAGGMKTVDDNSESTAKPESIIDLRKESSFHESINFESCAGDKDCFCPGPQREGRAPICIWKATPRNSSFRADESLSKFSGWSDDDEVVFGRYFKNPLKLDGVYLEMGALDGETGSNSLFFDEVLGWSGVLIEASPSLFQQVKRRRPHAIKIQMAACLDPLGQIEFLGGGGSTDGVLGIMPPAFRAAFHSPLTPRYNVSCAPLGAMLRHAGVTHLDLFSLDVENAELATLLTLGFDLPIRIVLIEINDLNMARNDAIHALLAYHGFVFARRVGNMNEIWENPHYADLVAVADAFARGERVLPLRPLHPGT